MSYGSKTWQDWVVEEEESIKQIKAAWDAGINVSSMSPEVIEILNTACSRPSIQQTPTPMESRRGSSEKPSSQSVHFANPLSSSPKSTFPVFLVSLLPRALSRLSQYQIDKAYPESIFLTLLKPVLNACNSIMLTFFNAIALILKHLSRKPCVHCTTSYKQATHGTLG
jgi:hypothetical protein